MALQTRQIYRFGEFSLDVTTKVLLRNGVPVRLTRRVVETLAALVQHPDQVLTKAELIELIWQGRVVDEANLVQNIAVVRRALQLPPGQPGYIETFPGRGYRLLGPITAGEEELQGPERRTAPPIEILTPARTRNEIARRIRFPTWALVTVLIGVSVSAALLMRRVRRTGEIHPLSFRRTAVARLGGKEFQPAITPDGASIAFVLDREDGLPARIWVKPAGRRPFIIGKPGWTYSSPAWSSDGKQIAYLRFGEDFGEAVVASADRGGERVITRVFKSRFGLPERHLDWSPDGKSLVLDDTDDPAQPFSLYLVGMSGERKRLSHPPANALGDVDPRFSPDGKSVSFVRVFHRARQGLFLVNLKTQATRALSDQTYQISSQDWSSHGRSIVLGWNRTGDFRLWRIPIDKPGAPPVPHWAEVYGDAPIEFSIARKTQTLVYSVLQEDFNIWRLDLKSPQSAGAWKRIVNSSAQDASPQYSPDGSQICFRSDRTGEDQLWVSTADGLNVQRVTSGSLRPSVGRWSPYGRSIVFNDSREGDLYIATKDTSQDWQVQPLHVKGTHPVFSPDGKFVYAGWMKRILQIPVSGGPSTVVSDTEGLSFGLSADGKSLLFVRGLTESSLWRLDRASGRLSQVLNGLVPYCTSCWAAAPDGIYYLRSTKSVNGQAIYFHNFASGREKLIAEYPEPLLPLGSGPFSLSPDGRYFLCVRVDPSNCDVMRIDPE